MAKVCVHYDDAPVELNEPSEQDLAETRALVNREEHLLGLGGHVDGTL